VQLDYPEGATPLDPDEAAGLIPKHIVNHGQLNEWELTNVLQGERWAFGNTGAARRRAFATTDDLLTLAFVRTLHKRMFGDTWRWAGTFRSTEKNIGIDPARIASSLSDLCEDVKTQLACRGQHGGYPLDEIATRLSHRLVSIHPFANGNGRLSRTFADLILVENGVARFTWGAANLVSESEARAKYLAALRAADAKDYAPLLAFVRS
jgi:Fic-DOC domain mobile mystery protein B